MNRVIKFRAWGFPEEVMYKPFTLKELCDDGGTIPDDNIYMQFTGLLDRNGNEIYEGDIVVCNWWKEGGGNDTQCIVDWMGAGFYLHGQALNTFAPESVEIIGNIYENSDLLV